MEGDDDDDSIDDDDDEDDYVAVVSIQAEFANDESEKIKRSGEKKRLFEK